MTTYGKDVQISKNESSSQIFVGKWDKFWGVKKAEVIEKIEDACGENLSLENLFTCKKWNKTKSSMMLLKMYNNKLLLFIFFKNYSY